MANIIETIGDLIAAEGISSLAGSTNRVFLYEMPPTLDYGVLLVPVPNSFRIRHDTPGYLSGAFMVVVRHNDLESALSLGDELRAAINKRNVDTTDFFIQQMVPMEVPYAFPRSEGDKYEVLVAGEIWYSEK